ncbi:NUDIX domain-containing protein [Kribbella sp. NBC_00382]|uniref:NUDIX hydrolase n=1 Tax=Kribbella sp. NBC_00382 TaxID=2975967 RepID=UPI002E207C10
MKASVRTIHQLVTQLEPVDALESEHRDQVLRWLEGTDDVFRRQKPATPGMHLVSYAVLSDPQDGSSLLVDHLNARRWLPPGGHVEVDEHPADTAAREVQEELGVTAVFADPAKAPAFVTVTETVGIDHGHTDVSLWFVLHGWRGMPMTVDLTEFRAARWWTAGEIAAAGPDVLDPHYQRFIGKAFG